jgi:Tol biopolymer transport system component/DNA-binding winged helix-turn-helix (wHTH) protein
MAQQSDQIYEFGPYRLDPAERLLWRDSKAIPLQPKLFDLLLALVERHGRLVEKDELMNLVWSDAFVEEANLASNISILRKTLGENGQQLIETVPKRGYRFISNVVRVDQKRAELRTAKSADSIGLVEGVQLASNGSRVEALPEVRDARVRADKSKNRNRSAALIISAFVVVGSLLAYFSLRAPRPSTVTRISQVTTSGWWKGGAASDYVRTSLATDGARLFFSEFMSGELGVKQVSSAGGETAAVPAPFLRPFVLDISPDRSELILAANIASEFEAPLWLVPVLGGPARRLGGLVGHAASFSPDGRRIVYGQGADLLVARSDGSDSHKLVTTPGRALWPRWSPDGNRLRFTVGGQPNTLATLWEVAADGSNLHPLLEGWNSPAAECCGNWTLDGLHYVFQSTRDWRTDIWMLSEKQESLERARRNPTQLTFGPLNYYSPVPSPDGRKLFVVGEQQRGELVRYDMKTKQFVPYLSGMSADCLDFSRDGEWITYTNYPDNSLWRSKVDGTERRQLTVPPLRAFLPRWSPDGKQIVFSAVFPGKPWRIYLVSAEGGSPELLTSNEQQENDVTWSPDGESLIFGSKTDSSIFGIYRLDLRTRKPRMLPGSEGFFSPRWSPDGRYVAAMPIGAKALVVFDFTTQRWAQLFDQPASFPYWSRDTRFIYFRRWVKGDPAIYRLRMSDRKLERVVRLNNFRVAAGVLGSCYCLSPDGMPVLLRDVGAQDIYVLDLKEP